MEGGERRRKHTGNRRQRKRTWENILEAAAGRSCWILACTEKDSYRGELQLYYSGDSGGILFVDCRIFFTLIFCKAAHCVFCSKLVYYLSFYRRLELFELWVLSI